MSEEKDMSKTAREVDHVKEIIDLRLGSVKKDVNRIDKGIEDIKLELKEKSKSKIGIGNYVTIGVLLVTVGVSWGFQQRTISDLEIKVNSLKADYNEVSEDNEDMLQQIDELRENLSEVMLLVQSQNTDTKQNSRKKSGKRSRK